MRSHLIILTVPLKIEWNQALNLRTVDIFVTVSDVQKEIFLVVFLEQNISLAKKIPQLD